MPYITTTPKGVQKRALYLSGELELAYLFAEMLDFICGKHISSRVI